jgi:hypothetical protein
MPPRRRRTGGQPEENFRLAQEIERVQRAARRRARNPFELRVTGPWEQGEGYHYMLKENDLLVSDADLRRVEDALDRRGVEHHVADALIGGVTLLEVFGVDVVQLLDDLDGELGIGVVTPNHVLDVQPSGGGVCPATEPEPATVDERWPAAADPALGRGVRVAVVDTGFLPRYNRNRSLPWLRGVDRFDVDDDAFLPDGDIAPYGAHGTFSAGVVLSVAPAVTVSVDDVLLGGVVDEATIVRQLADALADSPDVISLSAGTYTRHNVPPKALTAFYEHRLRHHKGIAVVAAAGNNMTRQPFWPAAFPWALAVGSLTRDGQQRSAFSNHGGWVDVYAPGEEIVNAFANGRYTYLDGRVGEFTDRMARWSGTSFATPLVAGLVARRMALTGENGQEAVESLKRLAQLTFLPGVGPRLLP